MPHAAPADVRPLTGAAELLALAAGRPFVAAYVDAATLLGAWAAGGAVAWTVARPARPLTLMVDGPVADAVALVTKVLAAPAATPAGPVRRLTVPRGAAPYLPLSDPHEWEWFRTAEPPPRQPLEELVRVAGPDSADLRAFLAEHSPRSSADPDDPQVRSWAVAHDPRGLVAVGAVTEHVPGVAHLASIATRADARGRGWGAAVTAVLTRHCLDAGAPSVMLGMYSDNPVAQRMYLRLGYRRGAELTSGRRVPAGGVSCDARRV